MDTELVRAAIVPCLAAILNLRQQGRVHEIGDRQERMEAIAKAYAEHPEQTLEVSPDNKSRQEIRARQR